MLYNARYDKQQTMPYDTDCTVKHRRCHMHRIVIPKHIQNHADVGCPFPVAHKKTFGTDLHRITDTEDDQQTKHHDHDRCCDRKDKDQLFLYNADLIFCDRIAVFQIIFQFSHPLL